MKSPRIRFLRQDLPCHYLSGINIKITPRKLAVKTAEGLKLLKAYFLLRDNLLPGMLMADRSEVVMRELLVFIIAHHLTGNPLSLKRLYLSFPSAMKVIRRDIKALEENDLIEVTRASHDKRILVIRPSPATLDRLSNLAKRLNDDDDEFLRPGSHGLQGSFAVTMLS
ncbi:MAG: hypothetical protein RL434_2896 [Pseudomonadota bacterium]|jgi:hypothetical protein